mmetsp:Transcript_16160/g.46022  ORF Transcript_16160/g.46022 Transcript_16160/m.46022 type:complete len:85 (+) Transcript_16160:613-867(+)
MSLGGYIICGPQITYYAHITCGQTNIKRVMRSSRSVYQMDEQDTCSQTDDTQHSTAQPHYSFSRLNSLAGLLDASSQVLAQQLD